MDCLDETTAARLLDRSLSGAESERVARHIDSCDDCRAFVAALAVSQAAEGSVVDAELSSFAAAFAPTAGPAHELDDAPARVGRYRLGRRLGSGAMGSVYAAYDPELGRELAIKLVRPGSETARLLREAKALAKVAHPSVVAVYDVGTVDDEVFIGMELVQTGTLRAWLAVTRPLADVLRVMTDVGRGLAAAHAAGLVHRDVKPDNILVDAAGRGRIGDFGLVMVAGDAPPSAAVIEDAPPTLTQTGALVGTPAYMAPEQFSREQIDARTDQFSFCVTLFEAIHGVRPFAGATSAELAQNVLAGKQRDGKRPVPSLIRAALRRGLATAPADRFPSMDALLDAIASRPRRLAIAAAAVALVGGAVVATWAVADRGGEAACPTPDRKLAGIWDAPRHEAVIGALAARGPFGAEVAQRVAAGVDDYTTRWAVSWRDTCESSRGEESAALFDLRVACLGRRLRALDALLSTLASADAGIAVRAPALVDALEPVAACDDRTALTRTAPPPGLQLAVATVDGLIDRVAPLRIAERYTEGRAVAEAAVAEAHRLGYRPREASALVELAYLQTDAGDYAGGEKSLREASAAAIAGNDDFDAAHALIQLVDVVGYHLGRAPEAHRLAELARASLERIGDPPQLRIQLMLALSRVTLLEGKHADSLGYIDKVIPLAEQLGGGNGVLASALSAKSIVLLELDRFEEARAVVARELELRAKAEGTRHPTYATTLENRANIEFATNQFDAGIADLETARGIKVDAFGPDTVEIAGIENNLGVIAGVLGDWAEELRAARVALALNERRAGPDHPDSAKSRANVGIGLRELGRLDEAEVELQRAYEIRKRVLPPTHEDVASSLHQICELRLAQHRVREAIGLCEQSRDTFVHGLGATTVMVAYATSPLGRAQLAAGNAQAARATLAGTIALLERTKVDPVLLARTRLALADAEWQLGHDAGAIAEAARAPADLAPMPAGSNAKLRAEMASWRDRHRR